MPGPGPKRADQRQRRNRASTGATLEAPPARKVSLPTRYSPWRCRARSCLLVAERHSPEGFETAKRKPHAFAPARIPWLPMTTAWWRTIWASPMADEWVDADVPGLFALAALVDVFWASGDPKIAAEVRLQQREYGLSPLARRQLQWEIKRLERTEPRKPGPRRRISGSVLDVLQGGKQASGE